MKADSLSRIYSPVVPAEPESILPPALVVNPIQWDITERICTTTRDEPLAFATEALVTHWCRLLY